MLIPRKSMYERVADDKELVPTDFPCKVYILNYIPLITALGTYYYTAVFHNSDHKFKNDALYAVIHQESNPLFRISNIDRSILDTTYRKHANLLENPVSLNYPLLTQNRLG